MSEYVCEGCGRVFQHPDGLDVHPCGAYVSNHLVRTIRTMHDPAQLHLDEF